jgi:hypothetical protein
MILREEKRKIITEIVVFICKCEICGSEFESKWGDPCCSDKCYKLFRERRIKRNPKLNALRNKDRRL